MYLSSVDVGWPFGTFPVGHDAVATVLLQRGAPFDAVDENGATALHYAVSSTRS